MADTGRNIKLPGPATAGTISVEQLLAQRRSVRDYQDAALELSDVGQMLWAAQGITHAQGFRTAPSAGALYPLELYVVAGNITGLKDGIYHYDVRQHRLTKTLEDDIRSNLALAAYSQQWIKHAPAIIVFTAINERTTTKYGKRGKRYVYIEAGHAAQNLFLQTESLGLATVVVGAFSDKAVAEVMQLPDEVKPLLLMPVGYER